MPTEGRMFGFLVGRDAEGRTHELWAYAGCEAGFVEEQSFVGLPADVRKKSPSFVAGEKRVSELTHAVEALKTDPDYLRLQVEAEAIREAKAKELKALRELHLRRKRERDEKRRRGETNDALIRESQRDKAEIRRMKAQWKARESALLALLAPYDQEHARLTKERSSLSTELQQLWFEEFTVPNASGIERSIAAIFSGQEGETPPSGTGECVAPKLFAAAFNKKLEPMHFEEFWWGPSPKGELRRHKQRYPPCRGRCRPLLRYMLDDTALALPPDPSECICEEPIDVIHEGQGYLVIHKPTGLLSVPGKTQSDSVQTRVLTLYPKARGPMIVHRLDQATSGLMLLALDERSYHELQRQFLERTVEKRYLALLEGVPETEEGEIALPLRVDPMDRPRQVVDFKHGKEAHTRWKLKAVSDGRAWVHFWPETGRTHQLRVHAAHADGLNRPIVGDPLYGNAGERLMLFAEYIRFSEPYTGKQVQFECSPFTIG